VTLVGEFDKDHHAHQPSERGRGEKYKYAGSGEGTTAIKITPPPFQSSSNRGERRRKKCCSSVGTGMTTPRATSPFHYYIPLQVQISFPFLVGCPPMLGGLGVQIRELKVVLCATDPVAAGAKSLSEKRGVS